MPLRPRLLAGAALACLALPQFAAAQEAVDAATVAQLKAQLQAMQARVDGLEARLAAAPPPVTQIPAPAKSATAIKWEGSPRFTDASGDTFKLRGRILLDTVGVQVNRPGSANDFQASQYRARQLYLGAEGRIGQWGYRLEGGVANGSTWVWDDATIDYYLAPHTTISIGNQKAASLENITSMKNLTFMERGPFSDVTDNPFVMSLQGVHVGRNWSVWAALQGDSLNKADSVGGYDANDARERRAATVRATWAPVMTANDVVHLGAWVRDRSRGGETGFTYSAATNTAYRPQTGSGGSLFSTGAVGGGDLTLALEGAWSHRNLSLQAEAADIKVRRIATATSAANGGPDFDIRTAYAFVSWFPTGEMRPYNPNGSFGRIKIRRPLDQGGWGALELAARWDYADLSDMAANAAAPLASQAGLATAGTYEGVTLGANWYPYGYVRLMANLTHGEIDNRRIGAAEADAKITVGQVRVQLDW
jgi:phosphate-selective porin OprO/OprP